MGFLLGRLLGALPVLAGVILATFLLTRLLPGDPAVFFVSNPAADAATVQAVREALGLDQPLWRQFLIHLGGLARGDLGLSITTGQPVTAELLRRLSATVELALAGFVMAAVVALPLGIAAALRRGSVVDTLCRLVATAGLALPTFLSGLLLIHLFYDLAGVAPEPIGRLDPFAVPPPAVTGFLLADTLLAGDPAAFRSAAAQIALPAASMAIFALAPLARMTRAAMLEALGADFIRAARANGLRWRTIVFSYALRNAMRTVVTTLGLVFCSMLGATVLVERVFAWPGAGTYALDALLALDHAPVAGFILVMAAIFVLVNLLTDIAAALVDPRAGTLRHG